MRTSSLGTHLHDFFVKIVKGVFRNSFENYKDDFFLLSTAFAINTSKVLSKALSISTNSPRAISVSVVEK